MDNLFQKFKIYVDSNGVAKAAFLLGYKDTPVIRNWLHRKSIPASKRDSVKRMFKAKVKIQGEF